jgi:hypothetical protein
MPESLNPNVGKDSSSRIEKERAAFLKFTGRPAGSAGGVAARNTQHQNMTQAVERLLSAIDESGGTDDEKIAASFEFMGFVNGVIKAAAWVVLAPSLTCSRDPAGRIVSQAEGCKGLRCPIDVPKHCLESMARRAIPSTPDASDSHLITGIPDLRRDSSPTAHCGRDSGQHF